MSLTVFRGSGEGARLRERSQHQSWGQRVTGSGDLVFETGRPEVMRNSAFSVTWLCKPINFPFLPNQRSFGYLKLVEYWLK